jgi:hypothetical protein
MPRLGHGLAVSEKLFHLRLHRRVQLDDRRPGAFETFPGNFFLASNFIFSLRAVSWIASPPARRAKRE